jgi:hypothetical protein
MRVLFNSQVAEIAADHSPLVTESVEDTISRLEDEAVDAYMDYVPGNIRSREHFVQFKHKFIASHI